MSGIFETLLTEVQELRKQVSELKQLAETGRDDLIGTREICKELDISKETFYNRFAGHPDVVRVGGQFKMRRSALKHFIHD